MAADGWDSPSGWGAPTHGRCPTQNAGKEQAFERRRGEKNGGAAMRKITWAIALGALLLATPLVPAEAAGGSAWGVHGGGGRTGGSVHGGGAGGVHRGTGGGASHAPRGSAWVGVGPRAGGVHTGSVQGHHWFRGGSMYSGHGHHDGHGHGGTRVFLGGSLGWWGWPGWWGPAWWGYPYYAAPPVVVQPGPITYIQREAPGDAYWYYCKEAGAYYPYVKDCPGGWMQVVPQTVPPGPEPGAPPQ